ncbi:MAG TPA: hypothetical protein VFB72_08265 [Verrucomicrobiae bacterium]|nr:hypothetical protein [Verrucomicrobiae bacterium]
MNRTFWKSIFVTVSLCAGTLVATAAPLQRADVAADPAWLLHLDFDAFRQTTMGQYILSEMDKPEAKARLDILQSIFSFDPRTQLHDATLYGTTSKPEDGVLIVYADFDPDKLVTLAKAAKDHQTIEHGKHVIHTWIDDKKKDKKDGTDGPHRVYAAIDGKRVIFGQRESAVEAALLVLDGTTPNLASGDTFADLGKPGTANFIEGAARKLDLKDSDPKAAMLKFSKTVELVVNEKEKQVQGRLTLVADNDEVAGHILSIAQGIQALMKFDTSKPDTLRFANAINIAQDGARVIGTITLPSTDVVEIMKHGAEKKKEKKESEE